MKTVLSWIRWKYFIPLLIIVATILVFFMIFFDPLLARGLEKAGSKINGAKVEIAGLKTKIFSGRISVNRLQVADADQPMQNRIETGPLAFQLDISELVSRRVIINEATLRGLSFGTTRKTSGALPKKLIVKKESAEEPPSAASKLVEKYKNQFKLNIDGIKGDIKSKIQFDPKDLELVKAGDAIKEQAKSKPKEWEDRVKNLDVENKLKNIEGELKAIKETPVNGTDAITAIPASLKKLNEVKSQLNSLKKDVAQTKTDVMSEVKNLKSSVTGLSQAKKKDLDDLMSRLNLDFASPDRLVEGIIGPMVIERFKTVFHYVQLARKYMPSQKEKESLPPKPRLKGMDIEFPTPAALPRFWLMQAGLDGTFKAISASGSLSNLTTDPARVGKPFKLEMKGAQGTQTFTTKATFDHTKDINNDSLVFQAAGLDIKSLMPSSDSEPAQFSQGAGRMDVALNLIGNSQIGGDIELALSGLKFDNQTLMQKVGLTGDAASLSGGDKIKADFMGNVARAIENMKEVMINAQVYGTWQDPSLKISSNLTSALSNVIKESVGNLVKDQRKEVEAKLNQILADKQKEVESQLAGLQDKVNAQLGGFDSQIQEKIAQATGINLGSGEGSSPIPGLKIPSLDKLFKK